MGRVARSVGRVLYQVGKATSALSTFCHYQAASTLRLAELRDGITFFWGPFYSHEVDVAGGLMRWEERLVELCVRPGASVLLIGSGTGRDLIPLVERGCRVTGIEPSPAMATAERILRERRLSATLVAGFFEDTALTELFDVVMFSWYSYSYIPESRRRIAALKKAASHLKAGGQIAISYPRVQRPRPRESSLRRRMIRFTHVIGALSGSDWRLEPGDHVRMVDRRRPRYQYWHDFQPEEIDAEIAAAGMQVIVRRDPPEDPMVVVAPAKPE